MTQTRLYVTAERPEARRIFDALEELFEEDGFPLAILEVDEERDFHEVSVYVEGDAEDIAERMRSVVGGCFPIQTEILPDIDWVAKSLEGLRPVRAGRFLVHGSHDRDQCGPGDIGIEIEAGQAFGTGHHGTTAGCLELIEQVVARDQPNNALDLGAGSAVLAIGIAKLAAIPVLATDIDPVAVEVARGNVRLNGAAGLVDAVAAAGFDHPAIRERQPFDLIVANILAGPLADLAPDMARHLAPGGSLILSGILERQGDGVLEAYSQQGFCHLGTLPKEGWITLHLKR
jgi:ribosomal protein L11 methyltransferase